ncbi:uncharacterized protein LOC125499893 [Athalia rosae]|uniref:uncharacterized protein LOC125499893 n=1 Tax=Athalia rosae TaxID=37344 RepID=UPI0020341318|nr:uncharacterized protein LOC125499893 [Athalia rosae]
MGDGADVVRQRMGKSVREDVDLGKNLRKKLEKEFKDVRVTRKDVADDLLPQAEDGLERHSGEPGEPTKRIELLHDFEKTALEDQKSGKKMVIITDPEVAAPFPYSDTKLRPEAPPFTPECVSPSPELAAYGEPENDSSCFVNVDLKLPAQEEEREKVFPAESEISPLKITPITNDDTEIIEDVRLKPFSLTAPPQLQKSTPNIEISETVDKDDPIVAVRPTTSTAGASETRETPIVSGRERVNFLSPAFFLGNKTQIIVLVASIIVCVILVIFVLV